jgi:hypothetical protein
VRVASGGSRRFPSPTDDVSMMPANVAWRTSSSKGYVMMLHAAAEGMLFGRSDSCIAAAVNATATHVKIRSLM